MEFIAIVGRPSSQTGVVLTPRSDVPGVARRKRHATAGRLYCLKFRASGAEQGQKGRSRPGKGCTVAARSSRRD